MIFVEAIVLFAQLIVRLKLFREVQIGEKAIVGNPVIGRCWFKVPQVTKLSHVGMAQEELHVGVTIINTVQSFTIKEVIDVVFNDWALCYSGMLGSSGLTLDSISPGENVLESFVLKSVRIDINHTSMIGNTRLNKSSVRN